MTSAADTRPGVGARLAAAWDRTTTRERRAVQAAGLVVGAALVYVIAWGPLAHDIERTRGVLDRDRATLATLQAYAEPLRAAPDAAPAETDARAAVLRALDARGLRAAASAVDAREGRVSVVLGAVPFDALVPLCDELWRGARLRLVEARVTARVEPGTVRAELVLGR